MNENYTHEIVHVQEILFPKKKLVAMECPKRKRAIEKCVTCPTWMRNSINLFRSSDFRILSSSQNVIAQNQALNSLHGVDVQGFGAVISIDFAKQRK
jgi:hypothetical protein